MKFCGQCAAPLAAVCASCGANNPPENKFCGQCAALLTKVAASRFQSPDVYTPKHLAERILTSKDALEGERKQVTVLFADLQGSMELLADRDPEEARKILDPVLERMMEAVHRYEGTVNQVMGDGIMALFGAPLAHEDHAVRACYAALKMQERMTHGNAIRQAGGIPVQIRVGINSGEVVVRSIGNDLHMDYTALGQTTHLAARMEQLARPGTSLITGETLRLAEGYVEVRPLGPVPVKGLAEPVEIHELLRAGPARSRLQAAAARGLTRFVGRAAEIEALHGALERARAGHGQIVGVVGDPGVGKSRLFWEFTHSHRTRGWAVLESRSVSYGKATAYLPVSDLLKTYFQIDVHDDRREIRQKVTGKLLTLDRSLEPTLPALFALLDVPFGDPHWEVLDPTQRRERTQDAVKRLLLRESQFQPLLLVFEDLHWVDAESQALLESLVESLPTAHALVLVSYRPEFRHDWRAKTYYTQLRIDPLPPETLGELLQSLLGPDAALEGLKRLLLDRTEGNPLFLEENVRALVETHVLAGDHGSYRLVKPLESIQVPATVQAVLAARIDRLLPEDKRLLQSAAVIGQVVPFILLRAIAEVPERDLRRSLADLQTAGFLHAASLFPQPEYTFKHALVHEVAYAGLLQERRRTLHAKAAAAIEGHAGDRLAEHAEALARHAQRGELWDKAVDALCEAGSRAFDRGAIQECLERHEQALALLPWLPASPQNTRRAIDVRWGLFRPLLLLGQLSRLSQLLDDAQPLAREINDQPRLGAIHMGRAGCALMNAQYRESIENAQQALDIAVAMDDPGLRVTATYALGVGHYALGDCRSATDLLTRIADGPDADLAKRTVVTFGSIYIACCGYLAAMYGGRGHFDAAVSYADRAVQAADASEVPQTQAYAYVYRAIPLVLKGEFTDAGPWLERAMHLSETKGLIYWFSIASFWTGWALAQAGRPVEGLGHLEQALALQERIGAKFFLANFYAGWADGLLLAGRMDEAKRIAEQAVEQASASGERQGEALALEILGEIALAETPPNVAGAAAALERTATLAEECGCRPLLARCHLSLGKLYRHTGEHGKAQEHLTTATTMYREMDMRFWLEQAEGEMRELET
jgi:class 3 adenylate cyclase/tetratricopeptide (TPR) repeat protein